ncbi:hypothetical protein [Kocuria sp. NPDC057446]|uniref:hypothetical protein n=1 Tax=Kocuria sp. NPDC057446 TaxID=3346137 RepID=UPI003682704F
MGSVEDLSSLSAFSAKCLLPDGYEFPTALAQAIHLSPVGRDMVEAVQAKSPTSEADAKAAALGLFVAGDTVLIDAARTDENEVLKIISAEIRERRIRYPWLFGRQLDSHYEALYDQATAPRSLPARQSYNLLDGVSQGVGQRLDLVVGPFGILRSAEVRNNPPLISGPNYQCASVGCNAAHPVKLMTGSTPSGTFYSELGRMYPPSERIRNYLADIQLPDKTYWDPFNSSSMAWLLGNGLTPGEQRMLLERLMFRGSTEAKDQIASVGAFSGPRGKWPTVLHSIDDAGVLQLLLVFSTDELVSHLEYLIDAGDILLTSSEVRTPVLQRHSVGGGFGTRMQLSRAGVRFTPQAPVPLMRTMLQAIYSERQDELAYQLLDYSGSAFEKLDLFLRSASEEEVLQRLVFSSRSTLERAFKELRYGRFAVPNSQEEARALEARLLWKLGGTMQAPPNPYAPLRQFGEVLRGVIGTFQGAPSEEWVTAVRSAGMDFFVEAEAVLAVAIDFSAWMLTTDHYSQGQEAFVFSRTRARTTAARLLAERGGDDLGFRESGNSMGTLLQACSVLADCIQQILDNEGNYRRDERPAWAEHTQVLLFPFRHTKVACDLADNSVNHIIASLRGVQSHFSRADVARTRNRLGHPPESFPTAQELSTALDGVLSALGELASLGLVPTLYQMHSHTQDASRREIRIMREGDGGEVILYGPTELLLSSIPRDAEQLVVVPGALIRETVHPLVFSHLEDTDFAKEWSTYRQFDRSDSTQDDSSTGGSAAQVS